MSVIALLMMAAQPTAPDQFGFDVRCMVAAQMASEQVKGREALATQMAAMFYFGRVDSVLLGGSLDQRLEAEAKKIEGRPLEPILKECGKFMAARGTAMQALGARVRARDKARN
jgi:hypothetical protein